MNPINPKNPPKPVRRSETAADPGSDKKLTTTIDVVGARKKNVSISSNLFAQHQQRRKRSDHFDDDAGIDARKTALNAVR